MLRAASLGLLMATGALFAPATSAQEGEPLLQPGEAYATRFSGMTSDNGQVVIYTEGVVGSIVDIRNPGVPPKGQHWLDEPQRTPVTAAEVGQVFGVALDDQNPPNIYLTATSAFGLHLSSDNADWMPGMWGPEAGPGTVYILSKDNGYKPEILADITLGDRQNSGAALGNIAYDKWNKQLYVTDLETGMIHRLSATDGTDLGSYDHGMQGRIKFFDAETGADMALQGVAFDPSSSAQIDNCASGDFSKTPACWNFADFRRRPWGIGVRQDSASGQVRVYYAIWGSQAFGNPAWKDAGDEQRNSMWSIGITENGDFDTSSVRREFFLPDFFTDPADIARAGYSNPVSDIAFPKCAEQNIMLVSERGGVRNLGLAAENPFAWPHESRVIRYELNEQGVWEAVGRYDVGFYDRNEEGAPFLRANSSGGIDFGLAYTDAWSVDPTLPNQFVWMTGDALCSPKLNGACFNPQTGQHDDTSQVHGLQGIPQEAYAEMAPNQAYEAYPQDGPATAPEGPDQSYMIDLDRNIDENGAPIEQELARNDATMIGDVEIYVPCEGPMPEQETIIPPPPAHDSILTHRRWGSPEHTPRATHRRWGSPEHTPRATHRRWGSPEHTPRATHRRWGSPEHTPRATHRRWGSPQHTPRATHRRWGSPVHSPRATHRRWGSPQHTLRATHRKRGSVLHNRIRSKQQTHSRIRSKQQLHNRIRSKQQTHSRIRSKQQLHNRIRSKQQTHSRIRSKQQLHNRIRSKQQTHSRIRSKQQLHNRIRSKQQTHSRIRSKQQLTPVHQRFRSKQQHAPTPTHKRWKSKELHNPVQVHRRARSKQLQGPVHKQKGKTQVHRRARSKQQQGPVQVHRRAESKQGIR